MKRIRERIRDWWRGYSDTDVTILRMKIKQCKQGGVLQITPRERNVVRAGVLFTRVSGGFERLVMSDPAVTISGDGIRLYEQRRSEIPE